MSPLEQAPVLQWSESGVEGTLVFPLKSIAHGEHLRDTKQGPFRATRKPPVRRKGNCPSHNSSRLGPKCAWSVDIYFHFLPKSHWEDRKEIKKKKWTQMYGKTRGKIATQFWKMTGSRCMCGNGLGRISKASGACGHHWELWSMLQNPKEAQKVVPLDSRWRQGLAWENWVKTKHTWRETGECSCAVQLPSSCMWDPRPSWGINARPV